MMRLAGHDVMIKRTAPRSSSSSAARPASKPHFDLTRPRCRGHEQNDATAEAIRAAVRCGTRPPRILEDPDQPWGPLPAAPGRSPSDATAERRKSTIIDAQPERSTRWNCCWTLDFDCQLNNFHDSNDVIMGLAVGESPRIFLRKMEF